MPPAKAAVGREAAHPLHLDAIAEVRKSVLFSGLAADELANVAAEAVARQLPRGATLFQQGSEPVEMYLLVDGWVKMTHVTRNGGQIALRFMQRGDHVGCQSVFRGVPFPATATAAADATVLAWKAPYVRSVILHSPRVAQNALELVGGRADDFLSRIQELASDSVEVRLARQLTRLVRGSDRRSERGVSVEFPISRQDLAELCGTTLFTVSRILTRWRELGLVDPGRQSILVRDIEGLGELINERPLAAAVAR